MRPGLAFASALLLVSSAACSSDPPAVTDAGATDALGDVPSPTDLGDTGEDLAALRRTGRIQAELCSFCHRENGVFAGQGTPRPMSTQYGANITPDLETGIGAWTDEQITRAVRDGVARDGRTLCNLMTRYTPGMLSDANLRALIVFLRMEAPVRREIPRSTCP